MQVSAGLRSRCEIRTGDALLLAASRCADLLLIYPMTLVEQALADTHQRFSLKDWHDRLRPFLRHRHGRKALLQTMGVSPEDLADPGIRPQSMPTFTQYVPKALKAASASSLKMWAVYLAIATDEWPTRGIDEPTASEIINLSIQVQERAALRNNSRDGLGARANFIDAIKFLYRCTVADHLISRDDNPARDLRRPAKQKSTRRPLTSSQLAEINEVAATAGSTLH